MNLIITVKQVYVMKSRIYKGHFYKNPTINQLIKLGANINLKRKDIVTIDRVSIELYNAIDGTWLR